MTLVVSVHFDHRSHHEARMKEVGVLLDELKKIVKEFKIEENPYVIVGGDFNCWEHEPAIHVMKGNDKFSFIDTFDVVRRQPGENYGTFNGWDLKSNVRIDYIFVTNNFKLVDFEIKKDTYRGLLPSDQ